MTAAIFGGVPPACRQRLVEHYGPAVEWWVEAVPALLGEAATRWRLRPVDYYDAGCASTIALARTVDGLPLLLKAWYDGSRYAHEIAALRAWPPALVPRVVHAADDLSVAALEPVGGRPGGAGRPSGEYEAVALGIATLHQTSATAFPKLKEHLGGVMLPRIDRRLRTLGSDLPKHYLDAIAHLEPEPSRTALLHADLYRENVPFNLEGRPIFIDPLPTVGDPAYDWAFWVVYYDLLRDPAPRLQLAKAMGDIPLRELATWCLTLCVDGLLYYREVGDPRAVRMVEVMIALGVHAQGTAPW